MRTTDCVKRPIELAAEIALESEGNLALVLKTANNKLVGELLDAWFRRQQAIAGLKGQKVVAINSHPGFNS